MWLFLTGSGAITTPELDDLADACSAAYAGNFLPILSDGVTLNSTQVVLYAGGEDIFEGVASTGGSGAQTGAALPANVACCISWHIGPHYKGGHPRTYLPGMIAEFQSGANEWTGSALTSLTSAADAFHEDLEAISGISSGISTVEHGIASFVRSKEWRTPPVFYRITGATVDNRIDTQRRRLGPDR